MLIDFKKHSYLLILTLIIQTACSPSTGVGVTAGDPEVGSSRLSELLRDDSQSGFEKALAARAFDFPQDHGPHPDFRNEWWYFTGNLDGEAGQRYGFELTIFRFSLTPDAGTETGSAWQANQVYIGHFAVTDVNARQFHVAQRYSRGAVGLAGAIADPFRVWVEDWSVARKDRGSGWVLHARDQGVALDLEMVFAKGMVLNGDAGLSRKSSRPGNATYYYSAPRLRVTGTLEIDDKAVPVSGLAWLDREWGSSALSPEQRGWDWFALQLSDGSDLMFYKLRDKDGKADEYSAGTRISAAGEAQPLRYDDVLIEITDYWQSGHGGRYPSAWTVTLPARKLILRVRPVLENQELMTSVRYWEGAVDVSGESAGQAVDGRGYVELTGYAEID